MPLDDETGLRGLGMMQALASAYAHGGHPSGPQRGIVDKAAALDAVMQVFAVIDEPLQAGEADQGRSLHAMSMLMLIREYIEPLPNPPGDEQLLAGDLRDLAAEMASQRL